VDSLAIRSALCVAALLASAGCASTPSADELDRNAASAIAGEWGIQMKEGGHTVEGTLHFSFGGTALVGSYLGPDGEIRELEKIRVAGGKIFWVMEQKSGTLTARGNLNGTIMSGKMKLRRNDEGDSGFGVGGGASRGAGGGRRVGEPGTYSWTAIKRAAS
jgi:hypothetical protein